LCSATLRCRGLRLSEIFYLQNYNFIVHPNVTVYVLIVITS
jgi:hypothetical protein